MNTLQAEILDQFVRVSRASWGKWFLSLEYILLKHFWAAVFSDLMSLSVPVKSFCPQEMSQNF